MNVLHLAYKDPPLEQDATGDYKLSGQIVQHFKAKITAIFNIALDNGAARHSLCQPMR